MANLYGEAIEAGVKASSKVERILGEVMDEAAKRGRKLTDEDTRAVVDAIESSSATDISASGIVDGLIEGGGASANRNFGEAISAGFTAGPGGSQFLTQAPGPDDLARHAPPPADLGGAMTQGVQGIQRRVADRRGAVAGAAGAGLVAAGAVAGASGGGGGGGAGTPRIVSASSDSASVAGADKTERGPEVEETEGPGGGGTDSARGYTATTEKAEASGGAVPPRVAASAGAQVVRADTASKFNALIDDVDKRMAAVIQAEGLETDSAGQPIDRKQDLDDWRSKREAITNLYYENRDRLDWAVMADVFSNLVIQWLAGAKGMQTGRNMSGVQYSPRDWSQQYDRLLRESQMELDRLDKEQMREAQQIDATNKRIHDIVSERRSLQHQQVGADVADERAATEATNQYRRSQMEQAGANYRAKLAADASATKGDKEPKYGGYDPTSLRNEQKIAEERVGDISTALNLLASGEDITKTSAKTSQAREALRRAGVDLSNEIKVDSKSGSWFFNVGKNQNAVMGRLQKELEQARQDAEDIRSARERLGMIPKFGGRGSSATSSAPTPVGAPEMRELKNGQKKLLQLYSDGKYRPAE